MQRPWGRNSHGEPVRLDASTEGGGCRAGMGRSLHVTVRTMRSYCQLLNLETTLRATSSDISDCKIEDRREERRRSTQILILSPTSGDEWLWGCAPSVLGALGAVEGPWQVALSVWAGKMFSGNRLISQFCAPCHVHHCKSLWPEVVDAAQPQRA